MLVFLDERGITRFPYGTCDLSSRTTREYFSCSLFVCACCILVLCSGALRGILLGCDTVYSGKILLTLKGIVLPPSSG
jgi:hypothetical protein